MTKDEIIDLAIHSGGKEMKYVHDVSYPTVAIKFSLENDSLKKFVKLVAKIERERCARLADEWVLAYPHPSKTIAETIRARGDNA